MHSIVSAGASCMPDLFMQMPSACGCATYNSLCCVVVFSMLAGLHHHQVYSVGVADAAALANHQSFTKTSQYDAEHNGHSSQETCTDQGAPQTPQRPGPSTTRLPLHSQQRVSELVDDHQPQQQQAEQLNADSQQPLQQLGDDKLAQQHQDQQEQQQVQQSDEDPHRIQHHHCDSQPEEQQHNLPRQPRHTPQLPLLAHQDLLQLQSHAADFADKDRRDWLINIRFLRSSMQQATWPGPIWPESELLDVVGRIVSNNFGIYTSRQRQQPHHSLPNAQEDGAPAGEASSSSALQSASSLHSGSNGGEATGDPKGHWLPLATPKPASSSQSVMPWPMQAATEQLVRSDSMSPPHGNSTADVCDTQRLFPALDSAVGALSVVGPAQCCTQQSKSSASRPTEAELSQVQRGRAASGIQKAKEDVIGREMYITASFFNHSCEPNCVKKRVHGQHSGLASVTALRDIKVNSLPQLMHLLSCFWKDNFTDCLSHSWCEAVPEGCLQIISCTIYQQLLHEDAAVIEKRTRNTVCAAKRT